MVMDWVTITLVSKAGMIYLSAFQFSTEGKGEGEIWSGLQERRRGEWGKGTGKSKIYIQMGMLRQGWEPRQGRSFHNESYSSTLAAAWL